ncbi:hypothetical protein LTR09_012475 [Extremus antarcticus]|uniref:Uncharacterized protein n=1 Tax=Extremus antarcticus TaxID=702011 RepID=A0AAJ0D4W1_9PEZI|nr:hypothetical protein LTR09_012475 [Extremus antarcticus]
MPDTAYHACLGDIDDISLDLLIETCERNYPQRDGIYEKAFAKIVERTEEMQDGREVDDNTLTSSYKMTYLGFINAEGRKFEDGAELELDDLVGAIREAGELAVQMYVDYTEDGNDQLKALYDQFHE